MNNGTSETVQPTAASPLSADRNAAGGDELSRTKRELLQAEVRLARARATVAASEIDVKVLNARLKSLAK